MENVRIRVRARLDLLESADYLDEQDGAALAERFLAAAEASFTRLACTPLAGMRCGFASARARRLRRWPVQDFENWLIFYLPFRDHIEIVRVIHGARDIEHLFS